jgi:hypothetical protein
LHHGRSVAAGLGVEHAVDVPERRFGLHQTHGVDRLAQERVRRGLDRTRRVGLDEGLQEDRGPCSRARVDGERVDADLRVAEVEVVNGLSGGRQTDAQLGERTLRVEEDDGAIGVGSVVDEVPGHHGALAAALAANQSVAVLAIFRTDRDRAVLVLHEHTRGLAVNSDRGARTSHRRAQQPAVLDPPARELPERRQLRGREHAGSKRGPRVRHSGGYARRVHLAAQAHLAASELILRAQLREQAGDATDRCGVVAGDA